ncbi:hypothetical protein PSCICM_30380 [Pseudomonas cichorii]|uniref:Branched-chain amino acid aminotransferase n=1 Tax=Pseudomonas cichorii TaxID=36746 RepID=A0ABQ1DLR1_PSECI|nr:hypothetical protein PSCICM_30380 [Pseudomonas cichorii]GFM91953.1 hypothetical protein PSCICP_19250 [Pseudomonas cichorii]SDN76553.1 Amino-transferase class IV [Pseudomonas cichorii]
MVLPGITRASLIKLAQSRLGLNAVEEDVYIDNLGDYKEAGACGTAAVITPIGGIHPSWVRPLNTQQLRHRQPIGRLQLAQ